MGEPVIAVEEMGFSVEKEEVFGFLGPSGADKSTTRRVLTLTRRSPATTPAR